MKNRKLGSGTEENLGAADITLTGAELARIEQILPRGAAAGERYNPQKMQAVNR